MIVIILYDESKGETEQDADNMKWFINMSIKDYDGDEPNITYPEIEEASLDYFDYTCPEWVQ